MSTSNGNCEGRHTYYVADVAVCVGEGKIVVVAMCTSCGDVKSTEVQVTKPGAPVVMKNKKENI